MTVIEVGRRIREDLHDDLFY